MKAEIYNSCCRPVIGEVVMIGDRRYAQFDCSTRVIRYRNFVAARKCCVVMWMDTIYIVRRHLDVHRGEAREFFQLNAAIGKQ